MPRIQTKRPVIQATEHLERIITETVAAQIEREKRIAKRDAKINEISAEHAPRIDALGSEIETNIALLEQWADANAAEWGDAKSTTVLGHRLGFRTGQPTVDYAGRLKAKDVLAALVKRGEGDPLFAKYVRVKNELNKEAVLATGRAADSADKAVATAAEAELDAIGCEIVQSETFYLEPAREGQPDTTLKGAAQ